MFFFEDEILHRGVNSLSASNRSMVIVVLEHWFGVLFYFKHDVLLNKTPKEESVIVDKRYISLLKKDITFQHS